MCAVCVCESKREPSPAFADYSHITSQIGMFAFTGAQPRSSLFGTLLSVVDCWELCVWGGGRGGREGERERERERGREGERERERGGECPTPSPAFADYSHITSQIGMFAFTGTLA